MGQNIYNIPVWEENTNYEIWDIVIYNNLYYYALNNHNSALSFNDTMWGGVTMWNGQNKPEFIWTPSYNPDVGIKPLIKKVQFGDGYVQRMPDGINNILLNLNLTFDLRTEKETRAILHFLHQRNGSESFIFAAHPPYNINKLYVAEEFNNTLVFADNYTVKAIFNESVT